MGQKKLIRFEAIKSFPNVLQYPEGMAGQWAAFLNRMQLPKDLADLDAVGNAIAAFVMPVFEAARAQNPVDMEWPPKGPWEKGT